jgi:hypothetical protein
VWDSVCNNTTTASRHHHYYLILALAVIEGLCFIILILREKGAERGHGEDDNNCY